ncbi:hypothetical protein FRC10_009963 [Ceratobasidium sp. 414]|nr:hypothetical protein FRC10_009963 [Ceratobasidium sp. 414]
MDHGAIGLDTLRLTTSMVDAQATLDTLRNIKNTIIGNPVAKNKLASDGTVTLVLEWINAHEGTSEPIFEMIRAEAAHIIAAQAYGPPESLLAVLAAQAPQALIMALQNPGSISSPDLSVALTRALRSVVAAAADTVGPFRWHLPRLIAHPARLEARLVLEDVFAPDALNVILPLLRHPELEVRRNVALLLGRGVRIDAHRAKVAEWNDRAAVWGLAEMLGGDARSQSSALYALAELSRDNDIVARLLASPIPPFLSLTSSLSLTSPSELGLVETPVSPLIERGRTIEPLSLFALTGRGTARSMSRPISGSGREALTGPRVLDVIRELLSARDGDVRESACLCLSTAVRQLRPLAHDPTYALIAWLNVTLEDFAPGPESPATSEADKCRWKACEVGGGDAARRVVRACHILADFVNDRLDLQQVAVKAGTLQRGVRALLSLPPVPVPANGWVPVGRWGPNSGLGSGSGVGVGFPVPVAGGTPATGSSTPLTARPGSMTIGVGAVNVGGPSGITRTRRASSATPAATPPTAATTNPAPAITPTPTTTAAVATSPMRTTTAPPPLPAWNSTSASSAPGRRLSFAELARRASESGPRGVETFAPRARRTSGASVGGRRLSSAGGESGATAQPSSGGSAEASGPSSNPNPGEAMVVDPAPATATMDVVMGTSEPTGLGTLVTTTPEQQTEPGDVVMSAADAPAPAAISAPAPPGPPTLPPALTPTTTTRRRRKPPPDPALGPYTRPLTPSATPQAPDVPAPPTPTSALRAALLVLLASLVMHEEEHRRMLVQAGALGSVLGQTGPRGMKGMGAAEGVTGVLGALGSADAEVRWSGTMVVRAVGRSTSVLRTGLYDSGIGRAIFEMLMRGDPDRRVLVAVLMMFIRDGGMARLVELADDTENAVKLNALWAIKNSLFKSTSTENRIILSVLGLLDESTDDILEQALGIIRNVTVSESDAEWLVPHITPARILAAIERALPSESTALAALFAFTHLCVVPTIRTQTLARRRTLEFVCASLGNLDVQVRRAAAQCVGGLVSGVPRRLRELREVGIDARLRVMRSGEEDTETRDHVRRALSVFEGRDV